MPRTFVEGHIPGLDLGARIARVGHVIHKDIHIASSASKFALDELEHQKTGFYHRQHQSIYKLRIRSDKTAGLGEPTQAAIFLRTP